MTSKYIITAVRPLPNFSRCLSARHTSLIGTHLSPLSRSILPVAPPRSLALVPRLQYGTKSSADERIEQITEMYATAKDEFEIASEETDKKSVYAADDREAAREELENLKTAFEIAVQGENGEEVRRRVGNRIRELEQGVVAMEERAMED